MKPFLRQVADHYLGLGDISERLFVFPNRRSLVFFRKYLSDALLESGDGTPLLCPRLLPMGDFFSAMTGRKVTDNITLLLRLYDCYKALNTKAEPLDDFIFWGGVILSDFADIDKYRVDVKGLFTNISDVRNLRDDFSYLTEEQRSAIEKLAWHFTSERWHPDGNEPGRRDVKAGFLQIWQILLPLYESYRKSLEKDGLAYEGMVYRNLADRMSDCLAKDLLEAVAPGIRSVVFVGLNALNDCEKAVLTAFRNEGLAEFCWDFSGPMVCDADNPSSLFMKDNVSRYPQALTPDPEGLSKPRVHVISVPSSTGQAKLLPDILKDVPEGERGLDFAVVTPDESMLLPVLSNLPSDIKDVNVTMGYPLSESDFTSLMRSIVAMQMHVRGGSTFYHRQVHDIFSNGVFRSILSEEENKVVADVRKEARSYIPATDLQRSPLFSKLFRGVITDMKSPSAAQSRDIAAYLSDLCYEIASRMDPEQDTLQLECARGYYCCVNRLADLELPVLPQTFMHLLEQLLAGFSVPFAGEPLGGLQVMGPLETRSLDFRRIVIMNANDGTFPSRNVSQSFIPPEMRRAFGLPTYELQDSVWAYYFYRLISRAEDVWMIYDSRTEGLNTGEESRYIKQLRFLYSDRCELDEAVAVSSVRHQTGEDSIPKTAEDIEAIRKAEFSPSTLQKYISCPASFYYYVVKDLKEEDEISDSLDPGMLGNVCHDTLEALFCGEQAMLSDKPFDKRDGRRQFPAMKVVTREYLEDWLRREDDIRRKVQSLIRLQTKGIAVEGRDLVAAEIAVKFVKGVIQEDLRQLGNRNSFRVIDVERRYEADICGHRFKGYVDRIDSFEDGVIRVVDYKTGGDRQRVLEPGPDPQKTADIIFGKKDKDNSHSYKAALQFHIYDKFISSDKDLEGSEIRNTMYSVSDIFSSPAVNHPVDAQFSDMMDENLKELFEKMEDPLTSFTRQPQGSKACRYCSYKVLCGRTSNKN